MKKYLHYLYKIFFFTLIAIVSSCEKEEIDSLPLNADDPETQIQSARKLISIEQIPELRNVLNDLASKQQKNASARGMITPILDYENILENTEETGKKSYSLRYIENMGEDFAPFSFKNLYLIETEEGVYEPFILEYIPESTWFKANNYRMDVANYTGTIKRYSSSNELEEEAYLVDGEMSKMAEMAEMGSKGKDKNKSIMICFYVGRTCTCNGDLVGEHDHFSLQVVAQCVVVHHPTNSGGSGSGGSPGSGTGAPAPGPGYGFPGGISSGSGGSGGGHHPDFPDTPGTVTLYPNIFSMRDVVNSRLPGDTFSAHRAWVDGQVDNNTMPYLYAYAMNNIKISARFLLTNLIAGAIEGAISDQEVIAILTFIQDEYGSQKAMAIAQEAIKAWRDGYEVVSIAPLVKYPKDSNYEEDYKKLTKYLKDELPKLRNNQKIIDAIKEYVEITDEIIIDALTWGQGPIIEIQDLGDDVDGNDVYGKYKGIVADVLGEELLNTIFLDIDLVNKFENSEEEDISKDALGFLIGVTILHEYIHLSDFVYQDDFWGIEGEEEGDLFEESLYGQKVLFDNYEIIFKNFKE